MFIPKRILVLAGAFWILSLVLVGQTTYMRAQIDHIKQDLDRAGAEIDRNIGAVRENLDILEERLGLEPTSSTRIPPYDIQLAADTKRVEAILNMDTRTAWEISKAVQEADDIYEDLSFWLIIGVIEVESGGKPCIVSSAGAIGLMQILPSTAADIAEELEIPWTGPEMLCNVGVNVIMGSYYLQQLIHQFGSLEVALAAYNWGPGHIAKRIRVGEKLPVQYPGKVLQAAYRPA